jgi:hypothetical protein
VHLKTFVSAVIEISRSYCFLFQVSNKRPAPDIQVNTTVIPDEDDFKVPVMKNLFFYSHNTELLRGVRYRGF